MLFVPFGLHINSGENTGVHSKIDLTIRLQIPLYNVCYTVLHCVTLCYTIKNWSRGRPENKAKVTLCSTVYLIVGMDLGKRLSVVSALVWTLRQHGTRTLMGERSRKECKYQRSKDQIICKGSRFILSYYTRITRIEERRERCGSVSKCPAMWSFQVSIQAYVRSCYSIILSWVL